MSTSLRPSPRAFPVAAALVLAAMSTAQSAPDPRGNVLLIVMDEIGPDLIGAYPYGTDKPPTPSLDALAASGVRFDNAYSNPAGSVAMATIETGRIGELTGVGFTIYEFKGDLPLALSETTLPEMLAIGTEKRYRSALFGKWFLGKSPEVGGIDAPRRMGYDHYEGVLEQLNTGGWSYFRYPWVQNGKETVTERYATTKTVDAALEWIASAPEPWYCQVAFHACHTPYHLPPADLFTVDLPEVRNPLDSLRPWFRAMVEALDTEIGRLIATLDAGVRERTTIIVLGDNGTPQGVVAPPLPAEHGKLTLYEGGIKIPLIISGYRVAQPGRAVDALVQTTDLFETVAQLAGVDLDAAFPDLVHQSIGLLPHLESPSAVPRRDKVFAELFYPNGIDLPSYSALNFAARDDCFKLVRQQVEGTSLMTDELYDLSLDPYEQNDLLLKRPLSPEAQASYKALSDYIDAMFALP